MTDSTFHAGDSCLKLTLDGEINNLRYLPGELAPQEPDRREQR